MFFKSTGVDWSFHYVTAGVAAREAEMELCNVVYLQQVMMCVCLHLSFSGGVQNMLDCRSLAPVCVFQSR